MNVSVSTAIFLQIYRVLSSDAVHRPQGYALILFAMSLSTLDIVAATRRVITFARSSDRSFRSFWSIVVYRKDDQSVPGPEYTMLHEDSEEVDFSKRARDLVELQNVQILGERNGRHSTASEQAVFDTRSLPTHDQADDTLHQSSRQYDRFEHRRGLPSRIGHMAFVVAERALVFAGYGQFILGIVTYTGV